MLCGATGLEIRFTQKKNPKPYTTCLACGIQTFFRGKVAIQRSKEIVSSGLLIEGKGSAVILFNRIQQHSVLADKDREQVVRRPKIDRLQRTVTTVSRRLDQAYLDKLDGRITDEFWERKSAEWHEEEQRLF